MYFKDKNKKNTEIEVEVIEYNEILINCIDDYDKILDNIDQNFFG